MRTNTTLSDAMNDLFNLTTTKKHRTYSCSDKDSRNAVSLDRHTYETLVLCTNPSHPVFHMNAADNNGAKNKLKQQHLPNTTHPDKLRNDFSQTAVLYIFIFEMEVVYGLDRRGPVPRSRQWHKMTTYSKRSDRKY